MNAKQTPHVTDFDPDFLYFKFVIASKEVSFLTITLPIEWFPLGAGSGIGRAVCRVFAREGAAVAAVDLNRDAADATIQSLPSGMNVDILACRKHLLQLTRSM